MLGELNDAFFSNSHSFLAFEHKGLGHHRYRENSHFLGNLGNDRRSPGTGTTTHTSSDEHHIGTI